MNWLVGHREDLGLVGAKAALMYGTALVGLRLGERRTLARWTIIDFATAVAMGAIIGRTAIAGTQSYVTGAVALLTLVAVHRACCGCGPCSASSSTTGSASSSRTARSVAASSAAAG